MNKEEFIKNIKKWDWQQYQINNSDLKKMNCNSLLNHVLKYGIKEKRNLYITQDNKNIIPRNIIKKNFYLLLPNDFEWKEYISLHSDLRKMNENDAKRHYVLYGNNENRNYKNKNYENNSNINFENNSNINFENCKITVISSLYNCDIYIDNYLKSLTELKNLQYNKLIIWNVIDSNDQNTNKKINDFCKDKEYITLLNKTKKEDTGLYDSWNMMLKLVDTELVCNFNADDKLHPDFINDYVIEFINDKNLNLLFSPLLVSKNINDNFNTKLPQMFDKKKIFFNENDSLKNNTESDCMNYDYKFNLLKKCLEHNCKTKTSWVNYNNISIFDFFRTDGNNFIDLNNYNLFTCPGCAPVWKIDLFKKYGGFNESEYGPAADLELWLRFYEKEGNFKKLCQSYVIYYNNPQSYNHSQEKTEKTEIIKRKIIKKYHPLFKLIDTKIDVIIPYRNREKELSLFIDHFKKSHDIYFDYNIIICEQNNNNSFLRSDLINYGINLSNNNNILITDVDILYKKIPLGFLFKDSRIYGIQKNQMSQGSLAQYININNLKKINGFSNLYSGWGSEDIDFGYRLFFHNINLSTDNVVWRENNDKSIIDELKLHEEIASDEDKEKKKIHQKKNNEILIQQAINYNLIFYYENKEKFINKDINIFYNDKLFFEGIFNNNYLIKGKLYDLNANKSKADYIKIDNVLIYEGEFINGLPGGKGIGFNLWANRCFSGLILNGYLFKKINHWDLSSTNVDILDKYGKLDILNKSDFKLYKKLVYDGKDEINYSFLDFKKEIIEENIYKLKFNTKINTGNKLHFSKKLICGYKIINDNYKIVNRLKLIDTNHLEIKKEKQGIHNLYYYDADWQYPVITEKRVFELFFENKNIPNNYFAFPWATLWDKIGGVNVDTKLLSLVYNFKVNDTECFTVCQHIAFRRLLPLFKKIGITHVFASHCSKVDFILEDKYNIKIYPFPLFPYNENNNKNLIRKNDLLCSFKGGYGNYYLTDIREKIKYMDKYDDCYVKVKNTWHFSNIVYNKQLYNKEIDQKELEKDKENEEIFKDFLIKSKFSLCPVGSGANTIRLWESLSFGSIPVILANDCKLPEFVDWDDICIVYDEKEVNNLYKYLKNISDDVIQYKSKKCIEIFNNYFSKENFNKTIEIYFTSLKV